MNTRNGLTFRRISSVLLCLFGACIAVAELDSSNGWSSWNKWTEEMKSSYVLGFSQGYSEAQLRLCTQIELKETTAQRNTSAFPDCIAGHGQPFDVGRGVRDVTTFYTTYPDSRNVEPREVLNGLLKGITLEEIHDRTRPQLRHLN